MYMNAGAVSTLGKSWATAVPAVSKIHLTLPEISEHPLNIGAWVVYSVSNYSARQVAVVRFFDDVVSRQQKRAPFAMNGNS